MPTTDWHPPAGLVSQLQASSPGLGLVQYSPSSTSGSNTRPARPPGSRRCGGVTVAGPRSDRCRLARTRSHRRHGWTRTIELRLTPAVLSASRLRPGRRSRLLGGNKANPTDLVAASPGRSSSSAACTSASAWSWILIRDGVAGVHACVCAWCSSRWWPLRRAGGLSRWRNAWIPCAYRRAPSSTWSTRRRASPRPCRSAQDPDGYYQEKSAAGRLVFSLKASLGGLTRSWRRSELAWRDLDTWPRGRRCTWCWPRPGEEVPQRPELHPDNQFILGEAPELELLRRVASTSVNIIREPGRHNPTTQWIRMRPARLDLTRTSGGSPVQRRDWPLAAGPPSARCSACAYRGTWPGELECARPFGARPPITCCARPTPAPRSRWAGQANFFAAENRTPDRAADRRTGQP